MNHTKNNVATYQMELPAKQCQELVWFHKDNPAANDGETEQDGSDPFPKLT